VSGSDDPYTRVYFRIVDDPRFALVYCSDRALAWWVRLLIGAEGTYPAPAALPRSVSRAALSVLTAPECGLVELVGRDHYRIHGLAAERERRSEQARQNIEGRWGKVYGDLVQPKYDGNTGVILDETRRDETKQDETRQGPISGPDAYCNVTLRFPQKGTPLYDWCSRLGAEWGFEPFETTLRAEFRRDKTFRTLLSRTEATLRRDADRQERNAELARVADGHKPTNPYVSTVERLKAERQHFLEGENESLDSAKPSAD
jgi:hypothetical protein